MYLHVGNNKNIRTSSVVGIFDMDNATLSAITRKYLTASERAGLSESAAEDIPKSFVLYLDNGAYKICFSQLSSSALKGRLDGES